MILSLRRAAVFPLLIAGLALVLSACDQSDASAVKIALKPDLSGEVLSSSVVVKPAEGPAQKGTTGVAWQTTGAVVVAKGTFADITKLDIGGITFAIGGPGADPMLRVSLPRGPAAAWPALFTDPSKDARKNAAQALEPGAKAPTIGDAIKIEISVPGVVVTAGETSKARGVNSSFEETKATLIVPVSAAMAPGDPIVWHITWREPSVR
jgi:hypothetical protein